MVFDNDQMSAKTFFRDLLYKHFRASEGLNDQDGPRGPEDFIGQAFTQITAFEEFVRAVEGVPRDAINIAEIAAQRAFSNPISVPNVRSAARDWYQRDKSPAIQENNITLRLLEWIIDQVIAHRKARAFLLRADRRHQIIDRLFDARLVHILKKSVSAHDQPGVRYFVYKLDYGCYVDLINTARGPEGLLPSQDGNASGFLEVPPDDYRSIRRAILDLDAFFENQ